MLLTVENNIDKIPSTLYTFLSTNITSGTASLPVKNVNGFNAQWGVQLGRTGEEQAEIINTTSIGGTALAISGTVRYNHSLDTPVYQTHYDSVIFLRSTTGTAGTALAFATTLITPDSFYTEYNDSSGVATYAYQSQYYNSVTGDTSGTSPWFIPGGPTFYSLQKLRKRGKDNLFSAGYIKDDETIDNWINEWVEVMTNSAIKVNQGYSIGTAAYAFGTAGLGTVTDPLFKQVNKFEVTTDGTNYVPSQEIPLNGFSSSDVFSSTYPRHYWMGDTVFGILPTGSLGTARLTYSARTTPLTGEADELPQSMKAYTTGCQEYLLYRAYDLDQKLEAADSHFQKFILYQNAFVAEITPRDQTGIKTIQFDESIDGRNEGLVLDGGYFL